MRNHEQMVSWKSDRAGRSFYRRKEIACSTFHCTIPGRYAFDSMCRSRNDPMIKGTIAFLSIPTGTWIKWITVFCLSIFDGVWLFAIWYSIFRDRGFATDERWIDRDETPFKFWLGTALTMTLVLGAIALTVVIATRHFLPTPTTIPDDGPPILP